MKENLDLNQILFDELVEFPRKRLGISIREFCAEAHVGTATYSKAKKKEFMGYGAGALKEVYRAMRRGMEK